MTETVDYLSETPPEPVLVLGVGNILLSDEGAGVRVAERIMKYPLPKGVEVLDGGTSQLVIVDLIRGRRKVIIVDAVCGDGPPGTLYKFGVRELQDAAAGMRSAHDMGVVEAVFFLGLTGELPEDFTFFGVEPGSLEPSLEFTPEVAAALPRLTELVMEAAGIPKPD
ncbi:MAG: hydrogenase maturation protease [Dehalogenimonas sp.]|uniref:Hydrogenase maturation protease n=1 Tax=Candidatus Dehalogenimonas loeffleri TaxID=3127115 RepID=A0ABZ2J3P9_9CHLR|nr:hydrogenase maturation protease [Dehalogenimonas sp.]